MARIQIHQDIVQEIAVGDPFGAKLPQVMVRIADRQVRLQGLFHSQIKPFLVRRRHPLCLQCSGRRAALAAAVNSSAFQVWLEQLCKGQVNSELNRFGL